MIRIAYIYILTTLVVFKDVSYCGGTNLSESSASEVTLSIYSNSTKSLEPSEFIELNITIAKTNVTGQVRNVSVNLQFPSQHFYIVRATLLDNGMYNASDRLTFNKTNLKLILNGATSGHARKLNILASSTSSLGQHKIISLDYSLQYDYITGNYSLFRSYSYVKKFYSFAKPSFLTTNISLVPIRVEGADRINSTITITNQDSVSSAYDLQITLPAESINITQIRCSNFSSATRSTLANNVHINVTELKASMTMVCQVHGVVKRSIFPGSRITKNFSVIYYHAPKAPDLYPLHDNIVKYIDVLPISGGLVPSVNASSLMAGDYFNLSISLNVPNSVASLMLRIVLPMYKLSRRERRSLTPSRSIPFVEFAQKGNLTYHAGSAIKLTSKPSLRLIDNTTIVVDFGIVSSDGKEHTDINASKIAFEIQLQVVNDPVNLSGRGSIITMSIGKKNVTLPFLVAGPILKPILEIQKYIQILDISKESPLLNFTVLIKHGNFSAVQASKITISDFSENIILYSRGVLPRGTVSVTPSYQAGGYIISAVVDQLKISEVAKLEYQGAFAKGVQVNQAKWKASVRWRSPQANSPLFGPDYSQELCLSTVKKIITKEVTSYSMIALGVVLGLILGALTALLILFCVRKTRVAKTYVFLDLLQSQDEEDNSKITKTEKQESWRVFSLKSSLLNRQPKQNQSAQKLSVDGDGWAFMAAAKYKRDMVENARYRTLVEELLRGHKSSFLFFVDSIAQIIVLLSSKLKYHGDISTETDSKIQQAANSILINYQKKTRPIDHAVIISAADVTGISQQYLAGECELICNSNREAAKLFETLMPKKLSEEMEKEVRSYYEELKRMVFNKANEIKQQIFIHVRDVDISRFGKMHVLAWSAKTFSLWSTWLSKKLVREIDIVLRKRSITDEDAKTLNENIAVQLKLGERNFGDETLQRLSVLQREKSFDATNILKTMDNKLHLELKNLEREAAIQASKSLKDFSAYILQRWQLFTEVEKECEDIIEQNQNEIFSSVANVIKELRVKHMKQTLEKIELTMIKHFSQFASNNDNKAVPNVVKQDSNDSENTDCREEGLKLILECLEDLQADLSGAESENDSLTENFLEDVEEASESVKKTAYEKMEDFGHKIEDTICQSRFQFKSLLFALRDTSQIKARSLIEDWMQCLQKTLTEIYVRKDLEHYEKHQNPIKSSEENEENVIFWFKDVEAITRSEFEKTKTIFRDYTELRRQLCQSIFENDSNGFEKMTKDFISKDVEQDFLTNIKTSCFTREFLICQQFLVSLIHALDKQQYLSDPEVKECFTKLKKAVRLLTKPDNLEEGSINEVTTKSIKDLLVEFHAHCDSLQPQKQSGVVSGIENMIFDEEGIAEKIEKVVKSKKKQDELMAVMEKLQVENLRALSTLVKMDKISRSDMMSFVKVLYMNVPKKRFDEIMKSINGPSEQDFLAELLRFQLEDETKVLPAPEPEKERVVKKKKKKKNNILRKNTVVPDK